MKNIKQLALAILLIIPCLMQAQIYRYSMSYDANGNRINRQPLRSITNPVTGTDSAVIAVADSALLNAINADKAETEQSIINVYPNPASDKVGISYSETCAECLIRIFDVEAKQVYETKGINKETEIDISNLKSGMYYLTVVTNTGKHLGWKIVKQ